MRFSGMYCVYHSKTGTCMRECFNRPPLFKLLRFSTYATLCGCNVFFCADQLRVSRVGCACGCLRPRVGGRRAVPEGFARRGVDMLQPVHRHHGGVQRCVTMETPITVSWLVASISPSLAYARFFSRLSLTRMRSNVVLPTGHDVFTRS